MKVTILPSAIADLAQGFAFYEHQQPGLGDYFLDTLFAEIDSLTHHAGIHRQTLGCHRLLARTFPFAIYYSVEDDHARIKAILDCRRDPHWIKARLK